MPRIERSSAGVSIEYDEEEKEIEDICRGCPYECFCHKYCKPEICRMFKDDFDKWVPSSYQSSQKKSIGIVRVLCGYGKCADGRDGHFYYRYAKVTSISDRTGYRVVSIRSATETEWNAQELENKMKEINLDKFIPPPNPWR